jgi:hypothetical protein
MRNQSVAFENCTTEHVSTALSPLIFWGHTQWLYIIARNIVSNNVSVGAGVNYNYAFVTNGIFKATNVSITNCQTNARFVLAVS